MNFVKAGLVAGMMLAAQSAHAATTIVFNNFLPPNNPQWVNTFKPWIADVERVTKGRVKILVPDSSVAPPPELYNAVQQGVVDGAFQMVGFQRKAHPELQLPLLPMTYFGGAESSIALWRTYEKFFKGKNDFKNVVLIGLLTTPSGGLFDLKPKPFESLADLKGKKMWALPGIVSDAMSTLGVVVSPGPAARMYEVISGGVVDSFCCINYAALEDFNVTKFIGAVTEIPGGLTTPAFAVFVRSDVWATISPEDQKRILGVSGEALARRNGVMDKLDADARARLIASGTRVVPATDAFVKEVSHAVDPVRKAWIDSVKPYGIDGAAALDFFVSEQKRIKAGR